MCALLALTCPLMLPVSACDKNALRSPIVADANDGLCMAPFDAECGPQYSQHVGPANNIGLPMRRYIPETVDMNTRGAPKRSSGGCCS